MSLTIIAMPSAEAEAFRSGSKDAYGNVPERLISDGDGNPCRHCLSDIARGRPMLVFSYRPFKTLQPYAETGPVFLCAETCDRFEKAGSLPQVIQSRSEFIVRGYNGDEQIVGGTGRITPTSSIESYANSLLQRSDINAVHIRSTSNNCYFCKMEKAG